MAKIRQNIEYSKNVSELRILMIWFSILKNLTLFCLGQSFLKIIHYLFLLNQILYFFFKLLLPCFQGMKHLILFHLCIIEAVGLDGDLLVVIEDGKVIKLVCLLYFYLFVFKYFELICDLYCS